MPTVGKFGPAAARNRQALGQGREPEAPMNRDHYAIVIGLTSYPNLGDLQGAGNDADSVRDWLLGPGGLPPENIRLVKSNSDEPGSPTRDELEETFLWLDEIARKNQETRRAGRKVGTRLYMHMAGHGFSPDLKEAALLAGSATPERVSQNIGATAWLKWFQDAGYFGEYVLVVDCCMDRVTTFYPIIAPLATQGDRAPAGPSFVAFAARRPLKAVESKVNGAWHGVFTSAFLDGLRGAAVTPEGRVTARSMAGWLRHAVAGRLPPTDRQNELVSTQPEIVTEDPTLVLVRDVAALSFDVTLEFPADANGKPGLLWSGVPPAPQPFEVSLSMLHKLTPGLYVVEVPEAGYRQGFEVVCSATLVIERKDKAIAVPAGKVEVSIDLDDLPGRVSVVDAHFMEVDGAIGTLATKLPFGIYKSQIRTDYGLTDTVFALDRPWRQNAAANADPSSEGGVAAGVSRLDGARRGGVRRFGAKLGKGAQLQLTLQRGAADSWRGVTLVDRAGQTVCDVAALHAGLGSDEDGDDVCLITLSPGSYFLRFEPSPGQPLEQSLILSRNWQLEVALSGAAAGISAVRLSTHLIDTLGVVDTLADRLRAALADGRPILTGRLRDRLVTDFKDPIEGIVAGHLLLLGPGSNTDFDDLARIVQRLRQIVGTGHPDVEALSLRCRDRRVHRSKPIDDIPMFEPSWRLLVEASQRNPWLVPASLWQRVRALGPIAPYLVWSTHAELRDDYLEVLRKAVGQFGDKPSPEQMIALKLPASALDTLH